MPAVYSEQNACLLAVQPYLGVDRQSSTPFMSQASTILLTVHCIPAPVLYQHTTVLCYINMVTARKKQSGQINVPFILQDFSTRDQFYFHRFSDSLHLLPKA